MPDLALALPCSTEEPDIRFQFEFHFHEKETENFQPNPLVLPKARKGPCSREVPRILIKQVLAPWSKIRRPRMEEQVQMEGRPSAV